MLTNLTNNRQKIIAVIIGIILYIMLANARSLDNRSFVEVVFGLKLIIPVIFGILFGGYIGAFVGIGGAVANGLLTSSSFEFISILGNMIMGITAAKMTKHYMAPITALALVPGYLLHLILIFLFGFASKSLLASSSFWWSLTLWLLANICGITIAIRLYRMSFYDEENHFKHEKKHLIFTSDKKIWAIIAAVFALITVIFVLLFYFEDIFITFIVGAALIILAERIKGDYQSRMKAFGIPEGRRKVYGYLLLTFWLVLTVTLLWVSIHEINSTVAATEAKNEDVTTRYINNLKPYLPAIIANKFLSRENVMKAEDYLLSLASRFLTSVGIFTFNSILIIPLLFFFYFKKKAKILFALYSAVPAQYHTAVTNALNDVGYNLHSFFSAKVIESLAIAVICAIGFFVAGLKGWLMLGFLAGFFNIVPYIGPIIGAIPPVLLALLDSPTTTLYVIITVVIAKLIDDFYLQPFMIAGKVKIDSLLSIILVLVGAKLFGVMGMVFALPIFIIYKIILVELYTHLYDVRHKYKEWRE